VAAPSRGLHRLKTISAIMSLCALATGCWSNSAMLAYEYDTHNQMVSDWCSRYGLGPTPALQEECVRRAWQQLPPSRCNDRPCAEQFNAYYGYAGSYRAAGVHVIK
jgi:hypothetical protein